MIVIDASVAVKWTVEEDLHTEALSLAGGDFTLIAPNLVIIETLNVLRRKVKRSETDLAQFDRASGELADVFDLLVPESALARQIALLSSALDHSVYDCAYLACALKYEAPLVTADVRFAQKVQNSAFRDTVVQLGPDAKAVLSTKVTQQSIERQALQLYQVFERTMEHVRNLVATSFGIAGATLTNTADLQSAYDSPSYVRLKRFVAALPQIDQSRLLAIAWFGRAYNRDSWEKVLANASAYIAMHTSRPESYVIQTFATLEAGLEKLTSIANSPLSDRT